MTPPILDGLKEISDQFSGFLIDLWGTIHDGERLIEGVAECLSELREKRKALFLLSNVPRSRPSIIGRMSQMGLQPHHYTNIITSGELVNGLLRSPHEQWRGNFLFIGPERERDILHGASRLTEVFSPVAADFILNTGPKNYEDTLEDYIPLLEECAAYRRPMLCANPDKAVIVNAATVICAGQLAEYYQQTLKGEVVYYGKPYRAIYDWCFNQAPDTQWLAIGDNLSTDIKGAHDLGISTLFLSQGIHRFELAAFNDFYPRLFKKYAISPTYSMKSLIY